MNDTTSKAATTIEQFNTFFNTYRNVLPHLTLDEALKKYIEQKESWVARLESEEFPVAFFGSFTAGKSTIINAILGREVLPEALRSVTAFPTILRRGEADAVFVYYMDEEAKVTLWNQLCVEIGYKIDKKLERKPSENYEEHLARIDEEVSKYEQSTSSQVDRKPLEEIAKLYQGWHDPRYTTKKEIMLSELKQYVEGHEDSLFIDRIEVFLIDVNISKDVILVDLPGLAVVNQRHVDFTKAYIQERAKAFVVCMKPNHLLEGEEIKFLETTHRSNPKILQRSFWVINQWDTLNELQRQEALHDFDSKVQQYGFSISRDRFFKFSALNYFLLYCIAQQTLNNTEKLKQHISNLSKIVDSDVNSITPDSAKLLLEDEQIKSFTNFQEALFKYLNTVAKDEFVEDARSELLQLIEILQKNLTPLYNNYNPKDDLEVEFRSVEVSRQSHEFIEKLRERIQNFAVQARVSSNGSFWKVSDTAQLEKEVSKRILQINREKLKNGLRRGIDVQENLSRFPSIIEQEVSLTLLLREKLAEVTEAHLVQRLGKLLLELKEVNKDYLPDAVLGMLTDKLSNRDILMRLNGLADSLFYNYGKELERIGLLGLNESKGNSLEERTDAALNKYKGELIQFMQKLVNDLNEYICGSFKNHVEYLEEELLQLLYQWQELITMQVARKVKVSEAVALEQQKRTVIKNSFVSLVKIANEL